MRVVSHGRWLLAVDLRCRGPRLVSSRGRTRQCRLRGMPSERGGELVVGGWGAGAGTESGPHRDQVPLRLDPMCRLPLRPARRHGGSRFRETGLRLLSSGDAVVGYGIRSRSDRLSAGRRTRRGGVSELSRSAGPLGRGACVVFRTADAVCRLPSGPPCGAVCSRRWRGRLPLVPRGRRLVAGGQIRSRPRCLLPARGRSYACAVRGMPSRGAGGRRGSDSLQASGATLRRLPHFGLKTRHQPQNGPSVAVMLL